MSFLKNLFKKKSPTHELFHPLSRSPLTALRRRSEHIKQVYRCPISGKSVEYECPESGFPTHCNRTHWEQDKIHQSLIPKLRQINEDYHDLARPNPLPELLKLPGPMEEDEVVSLLSWDSFFYTRDFPKFQSSRTARHITSLLTYPMSIGAILHKNSPYNLKNGLTPQGLQSLTALRYMLHRPLSAQSTDPRPTRIFVLGATKECSLPPSIWLQGLNFLFPGRLFQLHFIGPEVVVPSKQPNLPSPLSLHFHQDYYHNLHRVGAFEPFDPYYDTFFLPMPLISHPLYSSSWIPTLHDLVSTRCSVWLTSPSSQRTTKDLEVLNNVLKDSIEPLLLPTVNKFASLGWSVDDSNLHEVYHANQEVFGFRALYYNVQNVSKE
ncbi:Protein mss51 [Schizosaccharomyces pombe]|uniref:Protein mss51 n=1 Tax=Schizosaccharomyces pombe (strain 972 / ATCC 24843) TaxID=284812 RepID=MSS51_SCHPO|nr:putative splicing suppressor Mss51 [Schizosaccharomyces pombe]Q9UTB4.1 RecName: Full=Protein mss51 [Schizosaccharomyces pombe 972h-]CAB61770.1 mitochondrial splicing suppressor Mss51 (predicted) [Schizosaccharomyces pombe]|eukprot:NP_594464.1 putative splicing suppressor Mss51 [Schizosaccharomyces pombe]